MNKDSPIINWLTGKPLSLGHRNLQLVFFSRGILIFLAECLLAINAFWLALPVDMLLVQSILILHAGIACYTLFRLRQIRKVSEMELMIHILIDVLIMSWFFKETGGVANPFVSLLLLPLTICASMLPWRYSFWMILLTVLSYGTLFVLTSGASNPLMHAMPQHSSSAMLNLHIVGMWFNFVISATLISFFVVQMSEQIRRQQEQINQQKQDAMADEQLIGIATQAASAAHHMSTPLSTMSIIVNDLIREQGTCFFQKDLKIILNQINQCKHELDRLRQDAQMSKEGQTDKQSALDFIHQCIDDFAMLRPETVINVQKLPVALSMVRASAALRMAILNVLDNAADASSQSLDIWVEEELDWVHIFIRDYGEGVGENIEQWLENNPLGPVASTKPEGMGLGLFLSHVSINRFGGKLSLTPAEGKGTVTHIYLPVIK